MRNTKFILILLTFVTFLLGSQSIVHGGATAIAPSINGIEDIEYEVSDESYTVTWNITDDNPRDYEITMNGNLFSSGGWDEPVEANPVPSIYHVSVDLLVDSSDYT